MDAAEIRKGGWGYLAWVGLSDGGFGGTEGEAGREAKGIRNEVDAGNDVQLRFPVQGKVDRGVWEFVIQADDAHGTKPGLAAFESDVATAAIIPGESGCGADQLVAFVKATKPEAGAEGGQPFHRVGLVDKVFKADGIIDRGSV